MLDLAVEDREAARAAGAGLAGRLDGNTSAPQRGEQREVRGNVHPAPVRGPDGGERRGHPGATGGELLQVDPARAPVGRQRPHGPHERNGPAAVDPHVVVRNREVRPQVQRAPVVAVVHGVLRSVELPQERGVLGGLRQVQQPSTTPAFRAQPAHHRPDRRDADPPGDEQVPGGRFEGEPVGRCGHDELGAHDYVVVHAHRPTSAAAVPAHAHDVLPRPGAAGVDEAVAAPVPGRGGHHDVRARLVRRQHAARGIPQRETADRRREVGRLANPQAQLGQRTHSPSPRPRR